MPPLQEPVGCTLVRYEFGNLHIWLQMWHYPSLIPKMGSGNETSCTVFFQALATSVATVAGLWANQIAGFKSFCNLIGWHSSHSCNRILQELGKTLHCSSPQMVQARMGVWKWDVIRYGSLPCAQSVSLKLVGPLQSHFITHPVD